MDETSYNFACEIFKVALSYFKSLNLSSLNSKYLENSESISCREKRKELGKVQVTLQKMSKLC